jgi:hypothetical protein
LSTAFLPDNALETTGKGTISSRLSTFFFNKRVQRLKAKRFNIGLDEHGNRVRKSIHYNMKRYVGKNEKPAEQMR